MNNTTWCLLPRRATPTYPTSDDKLEVGDLETELGRGHGKKKSEFHCKYGGSLELGGSEAST